MKAYGIPRYPDTESPDLVDIKVYGFKSSISRCISKNGDIKNSFRNVNSKAKVRRYWKRVARTQFKKDIQTRLIEELVPSE